MPWSENDYPDSMKNLSPAVRKDAIEIANAILRDGGDDGVAIATGIKQAKKKHHISGVPMYYDMRKKAAEKFENDKSLAKETPLDGGKVVDNPAKIKDLKDKKGAGAVVADSEGSEGPGLQSFNNSLTNGGPAGSPNANQLAPVLGPKVSYYDMRKTAGDLDLDIDSLEEIRDEVIELMDQARRMIRGTDEEGRFMGYVYSRVLSAMGHESYPAHSPTLERIIQNLGHPEEP
jgi:uncharacterized protein YdaT